MIIHCLKVYLLSVLLNKFYLSKTKNKTNEILKFNFDKCSNEKPSIHRTISSYPAPKAKPLTKKEKNYKSF